MRLGVWNDGSDCETNWYRSDINISPVNYKVLLTGRATFRTVLMRHVLSNRLDSRSLLG